MKEIMKPVACLPAVLALTCILLAPQALRSAQEDQPGQRPQSERRWTRNWSLHTTNTVSVKSAFQKAISDASAATVTILSDGRPAALGVVFDQQGYIVTKASDLLGNLTCQTADGTDYAATLVGSDEIHDLAVLKIDASGLKTAVWRTGDLPLPGSLIASVAPKDELLSVGVVSSGLRQIGGSTQSQTRRGWLGVGLGDGEGGLGIKSVDRNSPAEKAGIQPGDQIVEIDGVAMKDYEQVIAAVGANPPGRIIRLLVEREAKKLELSATLGRTEPQFQRELDHWGGGPFSVRRTGFPAVLPHDSVIHPTECGSPLVDTDGKIVAINIARALRVTTYAVPAGVVLEVSQKLLAAR
jgi:serine protease Do